MRILGILSLALAMVILVAVLAMYYQGGQGSLPTERGVASAIAFCLLLAAGFTIVRVTGLQEKLISELRASEHKAAEFRDLLHTTLCSIGDVRQALAEAYRVLKPGGRFLFLEHGLSPEPGVQKWQRRLNWLEMRLADGCHLDRNMTELVAAQPFSSVEVEEFYLERTPKTHGYLYRGIAVK